MALPLFWIGVVKNHWDAILMGLLAVAIGLLLTAMWVRAGVWEKKYHNEVAAHAETRSAHNLAVANAALQTAAAERAEREHERQLQAVTDEGRRRNEELEAAWKVRVDELVGRDGDRRKQLLNHIGRLTNYIDSGAAGKDPIATIVNLQERLAACGQFLGRADDIAERCSIRYGEVRNVWDECTRDAKAVREIQ